MQMRSRKNIGKKGYKNRTRKNIGKKGYKNRTRKNYSKKKKGGASGASKAPEAPNDTDTFGLTKFVNESYLESVFKAFEAESTNAERLELGKARESIKKTAQSKLIRIINSLNEFEVTKEFFHIVQWGDEEIKNNQVKIIYTMLLYAVAISDKTNYNDVDLLNFIYKLIHKRYSEEYTEKYESLSHDVQGVFEKHKEVFKTLIDLDNKKEELRRLMVEAPSPNTYPFGPK